VTDTIKYDKHVANFIDALSATGHVTHRSYTKTSVTLHHNAGRLSHQGVLDVWKVRPASAHFDVDGNGDVAQYVKVNEYAWAAGDLTGNQKSIHIEMANSKLAPTWEVAEVTWKGAARLAGWLFYKEVGKRPTKTNFHYHSHWSATACAGPYMDKIYNKVLKAAQEAYDHFKSPSKPAPGPSTKPVPKPGMTVNAVAREVIQGKWGNGQTRKERLEKAGYDYEEIQARVEYLMGKTSKPSLKKTTEQVAREVIQGKWGNGSVRVRRLAEAGYKVNVVQAEVNRLMRG